MASFTDKFDRTWVLDLTAGDLRRVRINAGIELGKILAQPEQLAGIIFGDREKFGQVLWVLCAAQAEKLGVTEDTFADGFDRPTVDRAADAILAAVADFTQAPKTAETTKGVLRGLMVKADEAMAAEIRKLTPNDSAGN